MKYYTMYTLVDITNTGVTDPKNFTKQYRRSQNLSCVLQSLGLRAQIIEYTVTKLKKQSIENFEFGTSFEGDHRVWKLVFASEQPDTWSNGDDLLFHAINDVNGLPIYAKLSETAEFIKYKLVTDDIEYKNTYFTFAESN